jgi:hypothetical protein
MCDFRFTHTTVPDGQRPFACASVANWLALTDVFCGGELGPAVGEGAGLIRGAVANLMYGAFGTMALIAGLGPALVAFVLDRQAFRATLADNRQAETAEATAQDRAPANAAPAQRFTDDLGFAPLSSISAAIAVFSPLLASPLLELVASIVKISLS